MRKDSKAEIQHYVPRHALLTNFTGGRRDGQLFVFDKHEGCMLPQATSIRKIAGQRRFNEAQTGQGTVSLEADLTRLENASAPLIKKLIAAETLTALDATEGRILALFVAVQFIRVPRLREAQRQIRQAALDLAQRLFPEATSDLEKELEKEAVKLAGIQHIAESSELYARILFRHSWILIKSPPEQVFWISDCPVVLYNARDLGPYGNLGIGAPGIQIYLPISPHLTIGILDRGVLEDRSKQREETRRRYNCFKLARLHAQFDPSAGVYESFYETALKREVIFDAAVESGLPILAIDEHVTFLNHLQYMWSKRFVFSNRRNFELACEMARTHPELKNGIGVQII